MLSRENEGNFMKVTDTLGIVQINLLLLPKVWNLLAQKHKEDLNQWSFSTILSHLSDRNLVVADQWDRSPIFEIKSKKLICTSCRRAGADPRERKREREREGKKEQRRAKKNPKNGIFMVKRALHPEVTLVLHPVERWQRQIRDACDVVVREVGFPLGRYSKFVRKIYSCNIHSLCTMQPSMCQRYFQFIANRDVCTLHHRMLPSTWEIFQVLFNVENGNVGLNSPSAIYPSLLPRGL